MKWNRKAGKALLVAMLAGLLTFLVTGCGEECKVTIQDMNETTEVTANTRQTVKEVLEEAEITLENRMRRILVWMKKSAMIWRSWSNGMPQ